MKANNNIFRMQMKKVFLFFKYILGDIKIRKRYARDIAAFIWPCLCFAMIEKNKVFCFL